MRTVSNADKGRGFRTETEQLAPLGVELNQEKTRVVDLLKGEAFGFLGFDLRRVRKRKADGYFLQMTPKKKARKAIKAKVRDVSHLSGTADEAVRPRRKIAGHLPAILRHSALPRLRFGRRNSTASLRQRLPAIARIPLTRDSNSPSSGQPEKFWGKS